MAYCVFRADNLTGIVDGARLVSVRYNDGSADAAIENGAVLKMDSLIATTRGANGHVWKAVKPTANDTPDTTNHKLVVVGAPEIVYESNYASLDEFINPAGANCMAYVLYAGDTFGVTIDGFAASNTPDLTTNKYIVAANGTKLTVANAATNAFAELIDIEYEGGYQYYVIRVL